MSNGQPKFDIPREIGERLRAERAKLGLNQEDMAARGGVELNSQSAFERGKRLPSTEYLLRLEQHGVDIEYVLTGRCHTDSLTAGEMAWVVVWRGLSPGKRRVAMELLCATLGWENPEGEPDIRAALAHA